jgi:hypothetical protein
MRWILRAGCVLVFFAGVQLFLLAEYTHLYFAWTIQPPLTAAFLGAFYWTAFVLAFFSSRQRTWAHARVGDPPVLLLLILLQLRVPGGDPPRVTHLPAWFLLATAAQAAVLLAVGLALLVVPQTASLFWPWQLTPLTARASSAWILALAVILFQSTWEDDWSRVRDGVRSYVVLATLLLVALARYVETLDWGNPRSWIYLFFVFSMLLVGIAGYALSRRTMRALSSGATRGGSELTETG